MFRGQQGINFFMEALLWIMEVFIYLLLTDIKSVPLVYQIVLLIVA